jgi:hypothetical protein
MIYSIHKISVIALLMFLSISISSCTDTTEINKKEYNRYKIPNLNLHFFSKDRKDTLIDYLSKSLEWHVFPINKTVIAIRRGEDKNCNPIMLPLPSAYPSGYVHPIKYNFLNLFPDASQALGTALQEGKAYEDSEVLLSMKKIHESQKYYSLESNLVIESKNKKISFYTYESSRDIQRLTTTKYLVFISKELGRLAEYAKKNQHINDSFLPSNSTTNSSTQIVNIRKLEDEGTGSFSISGFINPGEKGIIYLKVMNKRTGEFILSDQEGTNAEYVGWSNNLNKKFNFCLGTKNLTGTINDKGKVLAEFQTWFKPSYRSPERILDRQTLLIDVVLK